MLLFKLRYSKYQLTSSGDRQGALNGTELLVGDERGVRSVTDINLAGLEVATDVLNRDC